METSFLDTVINLIPPASYSFPYIGIIDIRLYLVAIGVFFTLNVFFWLIRTLLINRLETLSRRTSSDVDDVFVEATQSIKVWVYTIVSLYTSLQLFEFSNTTAKVLLAIFLLAVVWQAIEIASCFIKYSTKRFIQKDEDGDGEIDPNSATAADLITLIARIVLWSLGALFVLSNLGIEVTSLIAGLGIGGIAVAFALQGILSDLFASFSLYFDKPFWIGDFIVIGSDSGTVEKIGIKSTRIRTLQGEELVVSNAELTSARVQNFKKMSERRIVTQFGVTYETQQQRLKEIPGVVTDLFKKLDGGRLDRVHFTSFGDSALIYEVVYYVESSAYVDFLDIQQTFNFNLLEEFSKRSIEFAYPTQTIFHKQVS